MESTLTDEPQINVADPFLMASAMLPGLRKSIRRALPSIVSIPFGVECSDDKLRWREHFTPS